MNKHLITVKYLGPTNTRGSRVKLTSYRFKESVTLDYDYSFNSPLEQAKAHLDNIGFNIEGSGEASDTEYMIISDTFKSIK